MMTLQSQISNLPHTQRLPLTAPWPYFAVSQIISHLPSRRGEGRLTDEIQLSCGLIRQRPESERKSKNRPKPNRTEPNPAKIKHAAKVCCSCSTSLSAFPFLSPHSCLRFAFSFNLLVTFPPSPCSRLPLSKSERRLNCKFIHLGEIGLFILAETRRWERRLKNTLVWRKTVMKMK